MWYNIDGFETKGDYDEHWNTRLLPRVWWRIEDHPKQGWCEKPLLREREMPLSVQRTSFGVLREAWHHGRVQHNP